MKYIQVQVEVGQTNFLCHRKQESENVPSKYWGILIKFISNQFVATRRISQCLWKTMQLRGLYWRIPCLTILKLALALSEISLIMKRTLLSAQPWNKHSHHCQDYLLMVLLLLQLLLLLLLLLPPVVLLLLHQQDRLGLYSNQNNIPSVNTLFNYELWSMSHVLVLVLIVWLVLSWFIDDAMISDSYLKNKDIVT